MCSRVGAWRSLPKSSRPEKLGRGSFSEGDHVRLSRRVALPPTPDATGTYVKVIQFDASLSGDAYLVLYLLRSGLYLFIGYWKGYEITVAAALVRRC